MTTTPSIDDLRVEDVATLAGVSPASIYVHFSNKDGLVAAAVNRRMRGASAAFEKVVFSADNRADRLRDIGVTYIELLCGYPAIVSYVWSIGSRPPQSDLEHQLIEEIKGLREGLERHLAAGVEAGVLRSVDVRALAEFVFGSWLGMAWLTVRRDELAVDRDEVVASVKQAWFALLDGLAPAQP